MISTPYEQFSMAFFRCGAEDFVFGQRCVLRDGTSAFLLVTPRHPDQE